MLPRLILGIAILTALLWYYQRFQKTPPALRRSFLLKHGLAILAVVLVLLALTGRMHWVGALIGVLLPLARNYLPLLMKYIPFLAKLSKPNTTQAENDEAGNNSSEQKNTNHSGQMSREQALEILGLNEDATREDVITAHRSLMQKFHPDRGGNDFLASQINLAKDLLLG